MSTCTAAKGSAATASVTARHSASWARSTASGTRLVRPLLRRRTSAGGTSNTTATHGTPARSAAARQPARRAASVPSVSITVVSPRRRRTSTRSSSSRKASVDARRSSSPSPASARSRSADTRWGPRLASAHVVLPDPAGPTSTTRHGDGNSSTGAIVSRCSARAIRRPRRSEPKRAAATRLGTAWPTSAASSGPRARRASRSMPVVQPEPARAWTRSSVARLPPAAGANGEPPSPPRAVSKRATPRSRAVHAFRSAVPRVSWRCRPTSVPTRSSTAATARRCGHAGRVGQRDPVDADGGGVLDEAGDVVGGHVLALER